MTFQHAHLCISIINKPKSLTQCKFYGQYFHSISTETALNSRVVSLKSTNTEDEERHFRVSSICSATSSRAPDHIIINSIIRMQAEMKIGSGKRENSSYAKKESRFPNSIKLLLDLEILLFKHKCYLKATTELTWKRFWITLR